MQCFQGSTLLSGLKPLCILLVISKMLNCYTALHCGHLVCWKASNCNWLGVQSDLYSQDCRSQLSMLQLMYTYEIADTVLFLSLNLWKLQQIVQHLYWFYWHLKYTARQLTPMQLWTLTFLPLFIMELSPHDWSYARTSYNKTEIKEFFIVSFFSTLCYFHYLCPCFCCTNTPASKDFSF